MSQRSELITRNTLLCQSLLYLLLEVKDYLLCQKSGLLAASNIDPDELGQKTCTFLAWGSILTEFYVKLGRNTPYIQSLARHTGSITSCFVHSVESCIKLRVLPLKVLRSHCLRVNLQEDENPIISVESKASARTADSITAMKRAKNSDNFCMVNIPETATLTLFSSRFD